MDIGAWWAAVHRVAKSQTELSTHASPNFIHIYMYINLFRYTMIRFLTYEGTKAQRYKITFNKALV